MFETVRPPVPTKIINSTLEQFYDPHLGRERVENDEQMSVPELGPWAYEQVSQF